MCGKEKQRKSFSNDFLVRRPLSWLFLTPKHGFDNLFHLVNSPTIWVRLIGGLLVEGEKTRESRILVPLRLVLFVNHSRDCIWRIGDVKGKFCFSLPFAFAEQITNDFPFPSHAEWCKAKQSPHKRTPRTHSDKTKAKPGHTQSHTDTHTQRDMRRCFGGI